MRCWITRLLVLLLLSRTGPTFAQSPLVRNYGQGQGLNCNAVYNILQDEQGYLRIATDFGVYRYDGYQFKALNSNNGLRENTVLQLRRGPEGKIWLYDSKGNISFIRNDSVHHIPAQEMLARAVSGNIIYDFQSARNGSLYFISRYDSGYYKISAPYDSVSVQRVLLPEKRLFISEQDSCFLAAVHPGQPMNESDYFFFLNNTPAFSVPSKRFAQTTPGRVRCIRLQDGSLLLGVHDEIHVIREKKVIRTFMLPGTLNEIYQDRSGIVWIPTEKGMVCLADPERDQPFTVYFSGTFFTSVTEDHEGGIWMGTLSRGLYYTKNRQMEKLAIAPGGHPVSPTSVALMADNSLVIGDEEGGILTDGSFRIGSPLQPGTKLFSPVYHLTALDDHRLFTGITGSTFDLKKRSSALLTFNGKSFMSYARTSAFNGKDTLYIAGFSTLGVCVITADEIHPHDVIPVTLRINNLTCDESGRVWFATNSGLYILEGRELVPYLPREALLREKLLDVKWSGRYLWMASERNGLMILDGEKLIVLNSQNGLSGNFCKSLFIETSNVAWVSTWEGLNRVELSSTGDPGIRSWTPESGMPRYDLTDFVVRNDTVWGITSTGMLRFPVNSVGFSKAMTPLVLQEIKVNSKVTTPEHLSDLRFDENNIELNFAGISFSQDGLVLYRYKTSKQDTRWSYTRSNRLQLSLASGSYQIIIQPRNADGSWSQHSIVLPLNIAMPFWKQAWFIMLVLLIFATLIGLFIYSRFQVLARREEKSRYARKAAELQLKALKAQMNPHFIFNALNSIRLFVLKNETDKADVYLSVFAQLIRDILDSSAKERISLRQERDILLHYLELESLRFSQSIDYNIEIDQELDPEKVFISPMLLQPFVENALWHGLMHKQGPGQLRISVHQEGMQLRCVIEDDGIGREQATEIRKKRPSHKQSYGLAFTRERLELLNREQAHAVSFRVIDLYKEDGKAAGTRVELTMPFQTNSLNL